MIHAALVVSLIASGVGPWGRCPDSVKIAAVAAPEADTVGITSAYPDSVTDHPIVGPTDAGTPVPPEGAMVGPRAIPSGFARGVPSDLVMSGNILVDSGHPPRRPRPVSYGVWYNRVLAVHRWASFAEFPLFAGEYYVGVRLLSQPAGGGRSSTRPGDGERSSLRSTHDALAAGLGALFAVNTLTGGYTLWASRRDPAGRPRRFIHTLLMLVSDAGFLATAGSAEDDSGPGSNGTHRALAEGSMGVALAGTLMMWVWRD